MSANNGFKHVVLEHLRIPTNSSHTARRNLSATTGMDFLDAYKRLGMKLSRVSFELTSEAKFDNIMSCRQDRHSLLLGEL